MKKKTLKRFEKIFISVLVLPIALCFSLTSVVATDQGGGQQ